MSKKRITTRQLSSKRLPGNTTVNSSHPASLNAPSNEWLTVMAEQASLALWTLGKDDEEIRKQHLAVCDALLNLDPKDEIEAMMVSQMIAAHSATMECFRRAMIPEQSMQSREDNLNHSSKMMRSFSALVDAFNRHRGKNSQRVEVRHVHIHDGGQAIVGMVLPEGGREKNG